MTPEQLRYEAAIKEVSDKLNLPEEVVDKTYKAYWKFVRNTLSSLPLKQELTEEEFKQLRTSVNVPSLGKFACTWEHYFYLRNRLKMIKFLKEENNGNKEN